ncbi:discoidin domain-containing protein [Streptomyces sp. NBC_00669]|uniref:discoidin domain-containing protein n=1 Tax=unclassified Streptomyces TaxID=2593676 RepID=UPI002E30EEA2|nr:discoidin domain-containing protein [Streptomyces sp. NBC_00669]
MGVTRRVFLQAAVAATATGTAVLTQTAAAGSASAASGPGDVVGKVTVGYQGWFACIGDGAPINAWWHWSANDATAPSPSNTGIVAWPDVSDYAHTYQTGYAALGNGQPATLFSSYDQQTVDTHFLWLQENGIDVAALQRFNPNGSEGPTRDDMAAKVRSSAEKYGRKFYIMYDVSDWTNMQSEIKTDWTSKMHAHTASSAYAVQNGKPVVCVWGFGFADNQRPFAADACLDVVNWFKSQGCYVIGGVPTWWRTGDRDSRAGFSDVYHAFDMLSPWMVGRIGNVSDADNFYNVATVPDLAECATYGIDYQPCVLPGAVTLRQRAHGDFMWRQFYNMVRAGVQSVYISMFDEFNEGNQIAKTAETQAQVPTNSGFLALDEDGTACSSDYYLRLTGDGGRMLKGQIALTATRPTQPVVGGSTTPPPTGNLALHRSTSESSHTQSYGSGNATDGDANSYWESANNAFPQWLQVDLGAATTVKRLVLNLPPATAWATRTQTLSVQGSADGSSFTQLAASAGHTFDPATGNAATVTLPASVTTRYVRLNFTANTGWPAAQLSEVQVFAS